jgi:hypothetical protein
MRSKIWVFLIFLILYPGCYYTQRSDEGAQISSAQIQEIKIGQTTEADLVRMFGPPSEKERLADGADALRYTHTRILNPSLAGGVVIEPIQREVAETFEIVLKNGAVQTYRFLKQADGGKE